MFDQGSSERRLYWVAQLGTWGAVALAHVGLVTVVAGFQWKSALVYGVLGVLALFASHALHLASRRWRWESLSFLRWLPLALVSSFVAGSALVASLAMVMSITVPLLFSEKMSWRDMEVFRDPGSTIGLVLYWSFLLLAWQLFHHGYRLTQRLHDADLRRWQLEATVTEEKLRALKAQLDPHFIFNSLNGIRALVDEDPPKARAMITRLAAILRFTLNAGDRSTVPLRDELETVRSYLALEAVRFEERLKCDFEIDPDTLDVPVPPMIIQHLVENGIKHGVMDHPGPGRLRVVARCERDGERLLIEVHNQGRLLDITAGAGVGLTKSRERLRLAFGDSANLELESADGNVRARMTLPVAAA